MRKISRTRKFFMSCGIVLAVMIGLLIDNILYVPPVPTIHETWWGSDNGSRLDSTIYPFQLNVSQTVLDDLKHRIERTRIAKPLENTKYEYGIHPNLVYNVSRYLINEYNWPERQKHLNEFPQFITNIQGLQIHYIHVKPSTVKNGIVKVLPLLMLHGFPSSMVEFTSTIPFLTERYGDEDIVFELIIPNIPGFGTSDGTTKSGLDCAELAVVMKNLMYRIGHRQYYVFGTDFGSVIASNMGILFPENVLGIYSPMCFSFRPKSLVKFILWELYPFKQVHELNRRPYNSLSAIMLEMMRDFSYMHQFSSQPDTIGISLNDSPIGLLAQILNLLWKGTNCRFISLDDAGISNFDLDIVLDNFMIHWTGGQIYSTTRLYAESLSIERFFKLTLIPVDPSVPVSCPQLPGERVYFPDWILTDKYPNLVRSTMLHNGGHFYNYERFSNTNAMRSGTRSMNRLNQHEMAADIFQSVLQMRLQRS